MIFNQYNGFNQLIKTTAGDKTIDYTYNGDGLRTSKTVNNVTTIHIWDGAQIVLELDGAGAVTNKYVRGINLLYAEDGTGTNRKWYLFNGHGDVVQLTGTDGNVTKVYDYEAFGNEKDPDPNDTNVFRYCGEYFDKETGTFYLRARYYDARIGRFISEDSIQAGLNWYTYCNGNPIAFVDPTGHIRQPGYVNGVWYDDPDAAEFGKDSATYQTLLTLGNLWTGTKDISRRNFYHTSADNVRELARNPGFVSSLSPLPTFKVDNNQGIYYSPQYSIQKDFGFNDFYDFCFDTVCDMEKIKMEFKDWRIEFWKGNYLNMGLGGEMGIYIRNEGILGIVGHYDSPDEYNFMSMSFALYTGDNTTPYFVRYDSSHWWVNGFMPGTECPADNIRMIGGITLFSKGMVDAFTESIPNGVTYTVNGLRVDFDWQ